MTRDLSWTVSDHVVVWARGLPGDARCAETGRVGQVQVAQVTTVRGRVLCEISMSVSVHEIGRNATVWSMYHTEECRVCSTHATFMAPRFECPQHQRSHRLESQKPSISFLALAKDLSIILARVGHHSVGKVPISPAAGIRPSITKSCR